MPSGAYFEADGMRRGYAIDNADLLISKKYEEAEADMTEENDASEDKQGDDAKNKLILKSLSAFQIVKTEWSEHYRALANPIIKVGSKMNVLKWDILETCYIVLLYLESHYFKHSWQISCVMCVTVLPCVTDPLCLK